MRRFTSATILVIWMASSFGALANENENENENLAHNRILATSNNPLEYPKKSSQFNKHTLAFGFATACLMFSSSFDKDASFTETAMDGVRSASLGIITSYLLNYSGPIFQSCYDYALNKFDQKVFKILDKTMQARMEQFDEILESRIEQIDNSKVSKFIDIITRGNTKEQED